MPQIINTNLSSINAQRNLDRSNDSLSVSLQRLSSGMRINSARDDAAGLAISVRFTSQITGLSQAQRNANDAISLAQVGEGALQEATSILQRARELAIQSANGTNSSSDRKALQDEVNQLKQELSRIASTTTFNGLKVLNGDLQNAAFQVGAESNQTIAISVRDMRSTAIGSNTLETNNAKGIEGATHREAFVTGALGSDIGVASTAVTNGYTAATFTVTNTTTAGITNTQTLTTSANDEASTIATNLSGLTGVSATAYNKITLSNLQNIAGSTTLTLEGQNIHDTGTPANTSLSSIATAINADTTLRAAGIYAVNKGTSVDVYATDGRDLTVVAGGGTSSVDIEGLDGNTSAAAAGGNATQTRGGRVDITLDQGYSVSASNANITPTSPTLTNLGETDVTKGNAVSAQTLTVVGNSGSIAVSVTANQQADSIAQAVNAVAGTTGVKAEAVTVTKLSGLSDDGTVSFSLFGDNATAAAVSATVTTGDMSALVTAVNNSSGTTGITAALGSNNSEVLLTHSTGKDIKVLNFAHSAAVDYQAPSATPVSGDGSTVATAKEVSIDITGNPDSNSGGQVVKLYDGGDKGAYDSTVVGGKITFKSSASFNVTSDIDGAGATGESLFAGAPSSANASTLTTVNEVDVSTAAGAQSAISVLDGALDQVSEVRAAFGAVQNRFSVTISNLANNVENLQAARSRIQDADFAAETASLTRAQILQQAGISILSQANSVPQNVLSLLQ